MKRPLIFCLFASFSPFNLWRCGRLICFRLLFAVANNCLCQIIDFENKFSVVICQPQQSMIATASLGLLKPAAVVSSEYRYYIFVYTRNEFRDRRQSGDSRLFFICEFLSFQPAYAASLCSLVGKGLCEPITTLASGYSCKPDSHSPTSPNYFVVSFAHSRSEPLSCSCGR